MYSFRFDSIQKITSAADLVGKNHLVIWHADKIPPHIGISTEAGYFSLKVVGKDENLPLHHVFRIANQKKILVLFIELKDEFKFEDVQNVFSSYDFALPNENTCLTPITELLKKTSTINQLSDLLIHLFHIDFKRKVFGLNLSENYQGIPSYGKEEIQDRLRKLENAKSQKCISKNG